MSGKPNKKWLSTMLKKHGSLEAVRANQQALGRKGGSVLGTKSGFASDLVGADGLTGRQRAMVVGAKGGSISKRGKAKPKL